MSDQSQKPMSIDDIAASMLSSDPKDAPKKAIPPQDRRPQRPNQQDGARYQADSPLEDDEEDATTAEEESEDEGSQDDIANDETSEDDDTDESPADQSEDEDDDTDEPELIEVDDDTLVTVTVDGEEVDVPLRELKKRYAGEGAIEKRLQQATEARRHNLEQLANNRDRLQQIVRATAEFLFTPSSQEPDPKLIDTNINEYNRQKALFDLEQNHLTQRKQAIAAELVKYDQQINEARQAYRAEQSKILRQKLPILDDPKRAESFNKELVTFAMNQYGFDAKMISDASHAGLFVMAADALRFHKLQNGKKGTKEVVPTKTKARTLKTTPASKRQTSAARQQKKLVQKAFKTGKVDDVAATMLMTPKHR